MTSKELMKIRKDSVIFYNDFNHLFIPNQKCSIVYGYFNECPIYLIYDYIETFLKKYKRESNKLVHDGITIKCGPNLSFRPEKSPKVGTVFYNKHYREYYIMIDKSFINCAGKYKHIVYDKILFHELGHLFNKDIGPTFYKSIGRIYARKKEHRADKMGDILMKLFGSDTSYDMHYTRILKRTQIVYSRKYDNSVGHKRYEKRNLHLIRRYKTLYH